MYYVFIKKIHNKMIYKFTIILNFIYIAANRFGFFKILSLVLNINLPDCYNIFDKKNPTL